MLIQRQQEWTKVLLCIRNDLDRLGVISLGNTWLRGTKHRSLKGWLASAWITTDCLLYCPRQDLESKWSYQHPCSYTSRIALWQYTVGARSLHRLRCRQSGNWVLLLNRTLDLETAPWVPLLNQVFKFDHLAAGQVKLFRATATYRPC